MNVISLFNGSIPLIALQMSAYKQGDEISLAFTKVLDRINFATDEEEQYEITDRKFWEAHSSPKMLGEVDKIFESMKRDFISGYELKYNKFYIGMAKDGSAKNFLTFRPKKNWLYISFKGNEDIESLKKAEAFGLELTYKAAWKDNTLKLVNYNQYQKNKEFIDKLIKGSMDYFNLL